MEQEDSIIAENHLSKQRKGEHQNRAGRKRASRPLEESCPPHPLALISEAPLEQRIIFNQLFVSMPGMQTERLYH